MFRSLFSILTVGSLLVPLHAAAADEITVTLSEQSLASVSSAVASATSPEDAARLFAKLASQAIGQAVADSLAGALGAVAGQTSSNAAISGWEQYVSGVGMQLDWPSPGLAPAGNLPQYIIESDGGGAAPAGVTVGISISGTF